MLNSTKYPWEPEAIFQPSDKYDLYPEYDEERISFIDEDKNVIVHESCINISQENYSQYIPFEMYRKYQGIDLMDMDLQIYFVNSQMEAGSFRAINVSCSENRIRFGWLVDTRATGVSGDLLFEIRAIGTVKDSNGTEKPYVWKSKQNSQITVLKSLAGDLTSEPDQDWYLDAVSYFSGVRDEVLGYKNDAAASQAAAATSEDNAAISEANAKTFETNAKTSETNAASHEADALQFKNDAADSAKLAKSWAIGGTSTRADEEVNNAKYWSETTKGLLDTYKTEINTRINNFETDVNNEIKDFTTEFTNKITELDGQTKSVSSALDVEISRADAAEKALSDRIDTTNTNLASEISRATAAEAALTSNLTAETQRATGAETALDSRVTITETKLATLISTDAGKSVRAIANEEIAAQLIAPGTDASMDTLQEIATWISGHPDDAAAMNNQITANANAIEVNAKNISANAADIAELQSDVAALDTKVDTKANTTDVNATLATKADVSALNSAVATINSNKADASTVATLSTSVDTLNASVNVMSAAFNNKADKMYVDEGLAGKSDTSHIHNYIHIGAEAPTDPAVVLWVDTVNGLKYYNGSGWVNVPIASN